MKPKNREFEYRLNWMEEAGRAEKPDEAGYGAAREAVFDYVARLEAEFEALTKSAEAYMSYHTEKFYFGEQPPTGLYPAIAKARAAIGTSK